jgi:hypothetical protein
MLIYNNIEKVGERERESFENKRNKIIILIDKKTTNTILLRMVCVMLQFFFLNEKKNLKLKFMTSKRSFCFWLIVSACTFLPREVKLKEYVCKSRQACSSTRVSRKLN